MGTAGNVRAEGGELRELKLAGAVAVDKRVLFAGGGGKSGPGKCSGGCWVVMPTTENGGNDDICTVPLSMWAARLALMLVCGEPAMTKIKTEKTTPVRRSRRHIGTTALQQLNSEKT